MRALILAAGMGTRISRYLSGNPKCTVDIGGETLIEYTVKQMKSLGIDKIEIIAGYNYEKVKDVLKEYDVEIKYNPFFDVTNSIASAWFAGDFISEDDDILIMNGDVYMEKSLLEYVINEKTSPVLFCDNTKKEEADYKFFYKNNILIKFGKELKGKDITGEYIGIAKINKDFIGIFKKSLNELIVHQQHSLWWENALYNLTKKYNIYVKDIEGRFWAEVDYIEDYEKILEFRDYDIKFNINVFKRAN